MRFLHAIVNCMILKLINCGWGRAEIGAISYI